MANGPQAAAFALSLACCLLPLGGASAQGRAAVDGEYKLVWSDEFDGDGEPDPAKWGYETGFVRNHEYQYYRPENARREKGLFVIEARRESFPNPAYRLGNTDWRNARENAAYTSASLTTKGLAQWKYGRFEIRARIDTDQGLWPAIWTLGVDDEWPSCGEIDVMEMYRAKGEPSILANLAWGTDARWVAAWNTKVHPLKEMSPSLADWSSRFHVWRMDWDEEAVRIYLDDELMNETRLDEALNPDGVSPFRQPHYLILNLAVGGDNGGDPTPTAFPRRYEIDYVRVYQR
jgi:Beta-glucanase/Beta-glucan synthetase